MYTYLWNQGGLGGKQGQSESRLDLICAAIQFVGNNDNLLSGGSSAQLSKKIFSLMLIKLVELDVIRGYTSLSKKWSGSASCTAKVMVEINDEHFMAIV
jgi:hypothetical protein